LDGLDDVEDVALACADLFVEGGGQLDLFSLESLDIVVEGIVGGALECDDAD
jgi:hypothetical protein